MGCYPTKGQRPESPCLDRKSTRLNSSHLVISYAVFCLKEHHGPAQVLMDADAYDGFRLRAAHDLKGLADTVENHDSVFFLIIGRPPRSTLFPHPTLFR